MAVILFNGTAPFKQIVNTVLTESPMWNLVTIAQAVSEKTFKNNMAAVMASWISDQHNLSYFRSRGHLVATVKFSTQISQWFWRMSKTGFQDDSCDSHLKFLISKVLFAFDLQVILLLQCKFQFKSPNGSEADVKIRSSIWWLWWPFWISIPYSFSYFYIYWLACCSIISFDLIGRVVCKEWSKTDFLISTILATCIFK